MRTHKAVLAATLSALFLALSINTATARRIELSNQLFRAVWRTHKLTFSEPQGSNTSICPATLEGSFHSRTISKVSGQLVGYVTKARLVRTNAPSRGSSTG